MFHSGLKKLGNYLQRYIPGVFGRVLTLTLLLSALSLVLSRLATSLTSPPNMTGSQVVLFFPTFPPFGLFAEFGVLGVFLPPAANSFSRFFLPKKRDFYFVTAH
jgi:hypothetical protein